MESFAILITPVAEIDFLSYLCYNLQASSSYFTPKFLNKFSVIGYFLVVGESYGHARVRERMFAGWWVTTTPHPKGKTMSLFTPESRPALDQRMVDEAAARDEEDKVVRIDDDDTDLQHIGPDEF